MTKKKEVERLPIRQQRSYILKAALFATGLSGIVAEYILATMATYFLGDSVLQWTLIVSVMLFAMGLGSRLSRYLKKNLLQTFIYIEFMLSLLVAFSSLTVYTLAAYTLHRALLIYSLSIAIGLLIGMEIPVVIRLNDEFENLRLNVASVIEKDYYGSLAGGLLFAFVGLPYLGLTYTPFVLGAVNFIVALLLLFLLWKKLNKIIQRRLALMATLLAVSLIAGASFVRPVIRYGEQKRYKDKIIYAKQTAYQRIVITQWQDHYWLYINGNQQLSTLDEVMYHEPLVHPVMRLHPYPVNILVLGGGDGCAVREILKYKTVEQISLVDLDPDMTRLARTHPVLKQLNKGALDQNCVEIINQDGYTYMEHCQQWFDIIIIDLPDPKTIELGRLYSYEFYRMCHKHLRPNGLLVTQAGSPYYATLAFRCIEKTLQRANFTTLPLHNQILTLGQWGWLIASKQKSTTDSLKADLQKLHFDDIPTQWLNHDAMQHITSFGKNTYPNNPKDIDPQVNTIHNPVLYRYYLRGNWDIY